MSEAAPESHGSFHGDYGKLSVIEYIHLTCKLIWILVFELPRFLLRYLTIPSHPLQRSFSTSLKNFAIRTTNRLLTYRQIRVLIRPSSSILLSSRRYSPNSQNLYSRISRPRFTGYWIIQSSFTNPQPPRHSDVTILFLHGGGYFASQPDTYLVFLLRLAEAILEQDIRVSIFALDYHLAPEFTYPTQLEETAAAYEYLLHEMAVSAEKTVLAGDSAGGHLVLSMLVNLQQRSSLPKPRGAMLFSPWLSLHHIPGTNAHMDVLSASFLRATGQRFLGPARAGREETMADPLLEFLNPRPETEWDAVLPSWLWVSGGTNEIMFDDLVTWTQALQKRLGRERVSWTWGEGEVHDWQWLETMDEGPKKSFLQKEGKCEDFAAVVRIGMIIGEKMARGKVGV